MFSCFLCMCPYFIPSLCSSGSSYSLEEKSLGMKRRLKRHINLCLRELAFDDMLTSASEVPIPLLELHIFLHMMDWNVRWTHNQPLSTSRQLVTVNREKNHISSDMRLALATPCRSLVRGRARLGKKILSPSDHVLNVFCLCNRHLIVGDFHVLTKIIKWCYLPVSSVISL